MKKILKFLKKNNISPQLAVAGLVLLGGIVVFTAVQVTNQISSGRSRAAGCAFAATIPASTCQEGCSETLDCVSGLSCIGGRCANPTNPSSITCAAAVPTPTPQSSPIASRAPSPLPSSSPFASVVPGHTYELTFAFLNATSGTSVVQNMLVDGGPLKLANGTILSSVTITGTQSSIYVVRYTNFNQIPSAMTFRVQSGAVKIAGFVKDVTTGAILIRQPGTQVMGVGNWKVSRDTTITKLP